MPVFSEPKRNKNVGEGRRKKMSDDEDMMDVVEEEKVGKKSGREVAPGQNKNKKKEKQSRHREEKAEREAETKDYGIQLVPLKGEPAFNEEEEIWAEDLCQFYTRNILLKKVVPYVSEERALSQRDMNWAAVNYFPRYPVDVPHPDFGWPVSLHIAHEEYTNELKRYMFDPFKRTDEVHTRIILAVCAEDPEFCLKTTLAQLLWYRFAIRFRFIEECEKKLQEIKKDWMIHWSKRKTERNATKAITGKKARRKPLVTKPNEEERAQPKVVRGPIKIKF